MNVQTSLGKTKAEIIYEIMISLNQGNCGYIIASYDDDRVTNAIKIYNKLLKEGVIKELGEKE